MDKKGFNFPNVLTMIRFLLGPFIAYFILTSENFIALGLFIVALMTDLIDGYIARKYKKITRFGKILDPYVDKFLFAFVIFSILVINNYVFWIWVYGIGAVLFLIASVFFIKKEMSVTKLGRTFIVLESIVLMVMIYGIVNQLIIILLTILLVIPSTYYIIKMARK